MTPNPASQTWKPHVARAGPYRWDGDTAPSEPGEQRTNIEPWLAALVQAEHVNLLVGSGLTTAVATLAGATTVDMGSVPFECELGNVVDRVVVESAGRAERGEPNLEDQVRTARELIAGLRILSADGSDLSDRATQLLKTWETELDARLRSLLGGVLNTEREIDAALRSGTADANRIRRLLSSFLLTFASRAASRERLHIFTTNYDRLIEYGGDLLGLRILDRFVGRLEPVFRASRLGVDLHYNPPGIRGEPRYLEGVVRLTKLHGSVDWRQGESGVGGPRIVREALPFGAPSDHPALPSSPREGLIVYPNTAKDIETLEYPYAELFRDFAAAVCQPNTVVVTYGYGFGDDHINRVLRDMLTIPSTHLAVLSYDEASGRIERFVEAVSRDEQLTLLIGNHFGDLEELVNYYLPKPAIDSTTWRMIELVNRRTPHNVPVPRHEPDDAAGSSA